ncbi:MAG: class I SAM-dependent methyltransferase [Dehalococcoidia bacterium]
MTITSPPRIPRVAVYADPPGDSVRDATAEALAARLGVPVVDADASGIDVLLAVTPDRLEARQPGSRVGPVFAEFAGGAFGHRRAMPLRQEALVRAVGFRGAPIEVVDATAGLGRDAMVLAVVGCRVVAVERHPITHALLADGLARAARDPELAPVIEERLKLLHADAADYQASRAAPPDVVYLDPMFPERTGSAVAKKELRLLGLLAAATEDADALFAAALRSGASRIVVKRPRLAPPLEAPGGPPVTTRLLGRSSRFDVYVLSRA